MRWTIAVLALVMALEGAQAQVIRGIVTEHVSGQPLRGVLVSETPLELVMLRGDDDPAHAAGARAVRISSFVLKRGELALRTFSVVPPK